MDTSGIGSATKTQSSDPGLGGGGAVGVGDASTDPTGDFFPGVLPPCVFPLEET